MTKQPEDLTSHNKADRPAVGPDQAFLKKYFNLLKKNHYLKVKSK